MRPSGERNDSSFLAAISGPVTSCALRLRKQPRAHEPLMSLFHNTLRTHGSPPVRAAPRPRSLRTTNEPQALREPPPPRAGLEHEISASSGHLLSVKLLVLRQGWAPRSLDLIRASLHPAPVRPSCARPRRQSRKDHACLLFVGPPRGRGLTPCALRDPLPEKMPLTDVCNQHSSRAPYEQPDSLACFPPVSPAPLRERNLRVSRALG